MIFKVLQVVGGSVLMLGYLPQIKQILKTRSTSDINLKTWVLWAFGVACVELYALNMVLTYSTGRLLLFTNTCTLVMVLFTLGLIVRYRGRGVPGRRSSR